MLYKIAIASICAMFSGCSINKEFIGLQKSKEIGFTSDGSYVLQDPPKDMARIYVFRDNGVVGSYMGYTLRIEYLPKTNSSGKPIYSNYQDSLGYMATGKTFYADVWANHPIALMAKTEAMSYIIFTPLEGMIYCVKGNMKNGFTMPRPNIVLVDKHKCQDAWIDYFKTENIEFQNQWRKVYNERNDKILLEPPFPMRGDPQPEKGSNKNAKNRDD